MKVFVQFEANTIYRKLFSSKGNLQYAKLYIEIHEKYKIKRQELEKLSKYAGICLDMVMSHFTPKMLLSVIM